MQKKKMFVYRGINQLSGNQLIVKQFLLRALKMVLKLLSVNAPIYRLLQLSLI
jgi:hypothetical protein